VPQVKKRYVIDPSAVTDVPEGTLCLFDLKTWFGSSRWGSRSSVDRIQNSPAWFWKHARPRGETQQRSPWGNQIFHTRPQGSGRGLRVRRRHAEAACDGTKGGPTLLCRVCLSEVGERAIALHYILMFSITVAARHVIMRQGPRALRAASAMTQSSGSAEISFGR